MKKMKCCAWLYSQHFIFFIAYAWVQNANSRELLYNRAVVVENKSSLLLKINFTNTQTLQLFMIYFNQKLITKDIKNVT